MVTFEPPRLTGNEAAQLTQLKSYLFQLSEKLNVALSNLDENNFAQTSTARVVVSGGVGGDVTAAMLDRASALKSEIIKTADIIQSQIDTINTSLAYFYEADSAFGTFKEDIKTIITTTAASVTQDIFASETITALNTDVGVLNQYKIDTSGYIRSGIVGYDGITPIIGIVIGQGITSTVVEGEEQELIHFPAFSTVLTSERLSFYRNTDEIAYMSGVVLYITNATITNILSLGDKWDITHTSGFTVKWKG